VIFITVGSAFPFDRLIQSMDMWANENGRGDECVAQIGRGRYQPAHMEWHETLGHAHFSETMQKAKLVVAHAGMGSVITAMRHTTPIVLMPRRFEAGEHTTDHQMATARWLEGKPGVFIAWDESDLASQIQAAEGWTGRDAGLDPFASKAFTDRLNAQLTDWSQGIHS
jgi:UDP-N-acetylglucosamine transferase subunit ALG13